MLSEVEGIRQFHTTVTSGTTAPANVSLRSLFVSPAETADANQAVGKPSVPATGLSQAQPMPLSAPILLAAGEVSRSSLASAVIDWIAVPKTAIDSFFDGWDGQVALGSA